MKSPVPILILAIAALAPFVGPLASGGVLLPTHLLLEQVPFSDFPAPPVHNRLVSDAIEQFYPYASFLRSQLLEGRLPLWNPYVLNGTPFLATGVSAVFSPVTLLLVWLSPESLFLWAGWLKMLVAGIGVYVFVRTLGLSASSGVVAGVAFMFSGYQIFYLLFPNTAVSMTIGWGLWATEICCTEGRRRFPVELAAVVCVACLGGHPESTLLAILSWFVYGVCRRWKSALWLGAAIGLGIFLSAVVLLPFAEFVFNSATFAQRSGAVRNPYFFPLNTLPGLFIPLWDGKPGDPGISIKSYTGLFYVSPVVLLLALFSLWEVARHRTAQILWGLVLASFMLVFGVFPFFDLFTMVPLLKQGNHVHAAQVLAAALSILAGFGVQTASRSWKGKQSAGFMLAVCLIGTTVLATVPGTATERVQIWGGMLPLWVYWSLVLGGVLLILAGRPSARVQAVSFLWITLSGILFCGAFLPVESRKPLTEVPEVVSAALERGGHSRLLAVGEGALPPNFGMHWRLRDIRGYESLVSARVPEIYRILTGKAFDPHQFVPRLTPDMLPILETLGCRLVLSQERISLPGLAEIVAGPPFLYELGRAHRVELATGVTTVSQPEEALQHVRHRRSPTEVVIEKVENDIPSQLGSGSIEWNFDEADKVELRVEVDAEALLVLRDSFHPGWRALVDGREVPVLRADYLFRALRVPSGAHTVRFEYRPSSFVWGLWISLSAAIVFGAILLSRLFKSS